MQMIFSHRRVLKYDLILFRVEKYLVPVDVVTGGNSFATHPRQFCYF